MELERVKVRADFTGDDPDDKAASAALKMLYAEAAENGKVPVGPVRLSRTKTGISASANVATVPDDAGESKPARARADYNGDIAKASNAAMKALRDKVASEHKQLVGPVKVKYTKTKAGDEYVTASAPAADLVGLTGAASVALANVKGLDSELTKGAVTEALKPLEDALSEQLKLV